jgi:phosphoserine aminotransferase
MARVINFSAGPAALPREALEKAQAELLDFEGTGMSVMEQSHRGKAYEGVHRQAMALLREVAQVPATHEILFLQGGASMQFAQIPMAFLAPGASADYVVNGAWGEKALAEAKSAAKLLGGRVRACATTAIAGKEGAYERAPRPEEWEVDASASYVHFTSNETIHGIQFEGGDGSSSGSVPFPDRVDVPLVCDMSSDFLWKPTDFSRFAFVYAGAQKNIGPSGLAVVVAQREFLARCRKELPKILRYDVALENESMYNTPPTFAIYMVRNVLLWLRGQGGLVAMEQTNRAKAAAVYEAIAAAPQVYRCPVEGPSRSAMNVVFRLPSEDLEQKFVTEAKGQGMVGLAGHRSVGGIRVSLYNAVALEDVRTLAAFMGEFARKHGG